MQPRPETSDITMIYNLGYDTTPSRLIVVQEVDKLLTSSLQRIWNDDELPTLLWQNVTVTSKYKMTTNLTVVVHQNVTGFTICLWRQYNIFERFTVSERAINYFPTKLQVILYVL